MKKISLFLGCAVLAIFASGCFSTHTNDSAIVDDVKVTANYEAIIELQSTKVSGTAQVNCLFGIFTWGVNEYADDAFTSSFSFLPSGEMVAKQGATYNACKENNADTLLAAKYELDIADYFVFKTVKCTATGFPGVVTGLKAAK